MVRQRQRDAALGQIVRVSAWYAYHVIMVALAAYAVLTFVY